MFVFHFQGLVPIMSVCDQTNTNASSINELSNPNKPSQQQTGDLIKYVVNGKKIIHCFDPSHLIKVMRNNLETKDLVHFIEKRWRKGWKSDDSNGTLQIASWDHLQALFRLDLRSTERKVPKLTEEHLRPIKDKMKVSVATQAFSNTCGSVMHNSVQKGLLPPYCTSTARLLLFVNDLFDSINCCENDRGNNELRQPVKPKSVHFEFWDYALEQLPHMFFIDKATGERNNRSSVLKKFESTIRGYKAITKLCFDHFLVEKINIR